VKNYTLRKYGIFGNAITNREIHNNTNAYLCQTLLKYLMLNHGTLTLNDHIFLVNLMPMTIGSFDIIFGMDWLEPNHADVMCFEKAVRLNLPNGDKIIVYGDKSGDNLRMVSCIKAQKYLQKKCPAFLAHIVDKGKEVKKIQDIPEVCDFPDVFPEGLPELPPKRRVEFRIDLVPGAAQITRAPYRLALPKCKDSPANSKSC
jgi:hypothetical protein